MPTLLFVLRMNKKNTDIDSFVNYADLVGLDISSVRAAIRTNSYQGHTAGLASGKLQANLAIMTEEYALDFMRFCQRNPKPSPGLSRAIPQAFFTDKTGHTQNHNIAIFCQTSFGNAPRAFGSGEVRRVARVIMPKVPSEPASSLARSTLPSD